MDDAKVKMEEMKSKAKAFMKNFNSPFGAARGSDSNSNRTFRGQGHRLGGETGSAEPSFNCPSSSSGVSSYGGGGGGGARKLGPPSVIEQQKQQHRRSHHERWERSRGITPAQTSTSPLQGGGGGSVQQTQNHPLSRGPDRVLQSGGSLSSAAASVKSPSPSGSLNQVEMESRETVKVGNLPPPPTYPVWSGSGSHDGASHFDPYSPIFASGTTHRPAAGGVSGVPGNRAQQQQQGQFQCPICQQFWHTEEQVAEHIDHCTGQVGGGGGGQADLARLSIADRGNTAAGNHQGQGREFATREEEEHYAEDLQESVAIFISGGPSQNTIEVILRIFRNILAHPEEEKYRKLRLENPKISETIGRAVGGMQFLETFGFRSSVEAGEKFFFLDVPSIEQQERIQAAVVFLDSYDSTKAAATAPPVTKTSSHFSQNGSESFNRELRIFYPSEHNLEQHLEVPESFYKLSAAELKSEAAARKKKIEDSQRLIPKSYREKQAVNARRRYSTTVVRVQLPDGFVVQGSFRSAEPTTSLYQFVSSILKDCQETFDLVLPAAKKPQVIPRFPDASGHCLTLEEAELVPRALLKFNPTGREGYNCLKSECYHICEPLTSFHGTS